MTTLPSSLFGTTPTATTQSYYYPQPTYPAQPVYPTQPAYGQDQFSVGLNDLRNRVYQLQTQLQQAGAGAQGNAAWVTAVNDLAGRVAQYQQAIGNSYASPYAATLQDLTARCNQMRAVVSQPAYPTYPTYPTQPAYPTYPAQPQYPGYQQPGQVDPIRQQRRMLRQQMQQLRQQQWQLRQQQQQQYQQPYGYQQQQNPLNAIVGLFQGLANQR